MVTRTTAISSDRSPDSLPDIEKVQEPWQDLLEKKDRQILDLSDELEKARQQLSAEMTERQHWAQYLHDAITQSLFSAGLIAEVLPRLWERDPAAARQSLDDLRRLTFGMIGEMRILLAESRPSILTEASLGDLLGLLGNALAGRLNIPVDMDLQAKVRLPAEVQVAFYRLCKEFMNHMMQRARAEKASLQLVQKDGVTEVRIFETGDTFEAAPAEYANALDQARGMGIHLKLNRPSEMDTELWLCWKSPEEARP